MDVGVSDLVVAGLVQGGTAAGLWAWARSLSRRHVGRTWRILPRVPVVAFGLTMIGLIGTMVFLVRAFSAVEAVNPSRKAALLAESISGAMNWTALFALPGAALYATTLVLCIVGSLRGQTTEADRVS